MSEITDAMSRKDHLWETQEASAAPARHLQGPPCQWPDDSEPQRHSFFPKGLTFNCSRRHPLPALVCWSPQLGTKEWAEKPPSTPGLPGNTLLPAHARSVAGTRGKTGSLFL